LNKSKIEWTQFTSNPVRGKCLHACTYCYAERIRKRFGQPEELSWHPEELEKIEKRKKPAVIFMGSMYDLFGDWVPFEMISAIIQTAIFSPQHTFLFLTKNPKRYDAFDFPVNCWIGYSDDGTQDLKHWVHFKGRKNRFVSFEPLRGNRISLAHDMTDAVIIGAMTGPGASSPRKVVVEEIIKRMGDKPIFLKDNLLSIYPELPLRQETAWVI
jgi:protein gp37